MKIYLAALLFLISIVGSFAQVKSLDYFVKKGADTTYCISLEALRGGGNVGQFTYLDLDGKEQTIEGKEACQEVLTYVINDHPYDLIPLKASKPDGYLRHFWRKIDGKIKLYYYFNVAGFGENSGAIELTILQLGNGEYYFAKRKNIKKVITPYLLQCDVFKKDYDGSIGHKPEDLDYWLKLYNSVCLE